MSDLRYWIGFQRVQGIGPVRLRALLDYFGNLETAWHASAVSLRAAGLNQALVERILYIRARLDLESEIKRLERYGIRASHGMMPNILDCFARSISPRRFSTRGGRFYPKMISLLRL